jgi:hypothetical protein
MIRTWFIGVAVLAWGSAAPAQEKKGEPIPAPRPADANPPTPNPVPGYSASPGTLWSPYQPQKYPVPGQIVVIPGNAYGYLPSRAVYGPAASPNDYPYYAFMPGYPYPGYTMINPYPRTVSSYSFGPSAYPVMGRAWRR